MELPDRSQAKSWEGKDVVDRDGRRLGRCVGVFADTATGQPEWLHVDLEGSGRTFVPALESSERDGTVHVPFTSEVVVAAPGVGDDEQLSKAEEIELYRHYGIPVETDEGSVLPASDATVGQAEASVAARAAAPTPVVGTSDRTSTGAASSSGADTSVAETDAGGPTRTDTGDTTALPPTSSGAETSALAGAAGAVSGGIVTPETGEQLPVLDPAAASVPVPEEQVTYVDEPERTDQGTDAAASEPAPAPAAPPAAEQPRPTLRRVPPATPPPAPTPAPAPAAASGSGGSALAPLGAVAGVAAAVAVVLQARERRQRRRSSVAARTGRLGESLRAGSAAAKASAGTTLAGASEAAEIARRSAATATGKAAKAAARQKAQTSSTLAAASKAASKAAAKQKRSAARSAAAQRKAARAAVAAAAHGAAQQRDAAKASLAAATTRSSSSAGSVTAVPRKVAKKGRKARRSFVRTLWRAVVLSTAGGGYVLGAKAGRQRYDELAQVAAAVAGNAKVQSATEAVTDPERRTDLLLEVQQQVGSLVGRRGEPRT